MRATRRTSGALAGFGLMAMVAVAVPIITAPSAQAAEPVVVISDTFEDGTTEGWGGRSAEVVTNSTAAAHGGTHSLLTGGRTASWQGPALDVLTAVQKGTRYTISVWVRLAAGEPATSVRLSVERRTAGTPSYDQVVGNTAVTANGWVNLQGTYVVATDVDFLSAYVETSAGTAALHVDDFTLSYVPATPIQTDIPAVKSVVKEFKVGAAITMPQIIGNQAQLLTRHFNSVTPGNALKWDATEPTEGQFRFAEADAMVQFAKTNNLAVRGHTLVWHQQTPAWVFQDATGAAMTATAANKALLLARLEAHIRGVVTHYGSDIPVWDVVNEVIDESQADGMRRSPWYQITGLDYIRTAFRVAREVAPTAKLVINDYNTNVPAKRDKLYALVAQLKGEGVPIDAVGHQMHINIDWPSVAETEAMLTKFIPLGVDQQITEMDVSIYTSTAESFPTPPADRLLKQAYRYRDLFALYRRYAANISSVTLWGLADDDTWLNTFPVTRKDAPLLFDEQLQAKSAYWAVVDPSRISTTASPSVPASPSRSVPVSPSVSVSPSRSASVSPSVSVSPSRSASASPSASVSPSASTDPGASPCRVTYTIVSQWTGGFQGDVKIACSQAVSGWKVGWAFPNGQTITQIWGGAFAQSGAQVTVDNAPWNAAISANGSVTFGFIGKWSGANGKPIGFTVNGRPA